MKKSVDRLSLIKSMSQQCIAVRIRLLSRMVTNIYDSALSPFGVKLNQISILVFVHLAGEVGYDALCQTAEDGKINSQQKYRAHEKKGMAQYRNRQGRKKEIFKNYSRRRGAFGKGA